MIVVDASVAVKWALNEPGSAEARSLLYGPEAIKAPELLRVEGASAVTRAVRNGRLAETDAIGVLEVLLGSLEGGAVGLEPDLTDLRRAVELSCGLRHPVPDCLYLALAERLDADLLTADETFHRRAAPTHPRVRFFAAGDA